MKRLLGTFKAFYTQPEKKVNTKRNIIVKPIHLMIPLKTNRYINK